jgi:hypothetical protein
MQDDRKKNLKVALPGMSERAQKMLAMYLQGPCKSVGAIIVESSDAEVDIIDIDLPGGKIILDKKRVAESDTPSIVLSLADMDSATSDTIFYIKKPVTQEAMLNALNRAKNHILNNSNKTTNRPETKSNLLDEPLLEPEVQEAINEPVKPTPLKHYTADVSDRNKTSKHKTAMQMDEKGFAAYMGLMASLDITHPAQLKQASYNPRDYFQGYVQSALKVASARAQILQLNSGWKPLLIFPHNHEIWLNADDKQLRAFAGIIINKSGYSHKNMSVTPLDPNSVANCDLDKFQSMDALVWKLACWTSKGRYPQQINIDFPVSLKHWPNFTRLLITPHAMRIAALLADKPRTPTNIAVTLRIKPEYVFIFISAAFAIGLLNQAAGNANIAVAPQEIKPDKRHSLFSRIISKLRANKE